MKLCSSRKNQYPSHGRSLEIPRGRGVLKAKILEAKYEAKLEFLGGRGYKTKTFHGGSMDIFWNYTFLFTLIFTCSNIQVMRVKKVITKDEMS